MGFLWVHYALYGIARVRVRTTQNEVVVIRESGVAGRTLNQWAVPIGIAVLGFLAYTIWPPDPNVGEPDVATKLIVGACIAALLCYILGVVCPPKSRPFKNVDFLVLNQVEEFQVEKIEIQ